MAGNVFDLSDSNVRLPQLFIVDTNIVAERLLASIMVSLSGYNATQAQCAGDLFQRLDNENKVGLITPIIYGEFMHLAIKVNYQQYVIDQGSKNESWTRRYKTNPDFIQTLRSDLKSLRFLLSVNRLRFMGPDDLGPVNQNTPYDHRLIELCCTYSLDTQDAGILLEAERLGVRSIVTMDADLRRAQSDFDIYTWL